MHGTHYGQSTHRQRLKPKCDAQEHVGEVVVQRLPPEAEFHGGPCLQRQPPRGKGRDQPLSTDRASYLPSYIPSDGYQSGLQLSSGVSMDPLSRSRPLHTPPKASLSQSLEGPREEVIVSLSRTKASIATGPLENYPFW